MPTQKEKRIYIVIAIIYAVTAVYITIKHTVQGNSQFIFMGPVSLLFFLIPFATEKIFRQPIGFSFKVFILVFSYFAFCIGVALRLYEVIPMFDKAMHLISGLLFFCVGFYFYARLSKSVPYRLADNWPLQLTYAFFFSITIAVVWEIYEFLGFVIIGHDAQHHLTTGVFDTMMDIIACFIGTLIPGILYAIYGAKGRRSFVVSMLEAILPSTSNSR